ncbi:MAG: bifunctional UDP-4-keto-pentose/UDP-xylose synthase [Verrucomicrobiota bacterium]
MKKILILGAGGFIGSHLATELMRRDSFEITALDITHEKLNEGLSRAIQFDSMAPEGISSSAALESIREKILFVELDLMDESRRNDVKDLIRDHEIIVNLVAICNPALYVSDPIYTFEIGFRSNLMIFDYCAEMDRRLIQFSTSEVYGKSPSIYLPDEAFPFNEETSDLIMGPINKHRWIYASGKQLLERIIHAHGVMRGFRYSVIRPFNYIGEMIDYLPSEKSGNPRVFSHFMDALLTGNPLQLVNGGHQKRCYTFIGDATDAHVRIIENEESCNQQIFNVGTNDNETSIRDLAFRMRDIYNEKFRSADEPQSEIAEVTGEDFYGKGYDDIDRRLLDNSKLVSLTGWSPQWNLDQMLTRIMTYYVQKVKDRDCLTPR